MSRPSWIGYELGGRYKIEELLGQGGMSAVYRAIDPNLRRSVAVKLIHGHLSSDEGFVRRFEEEAANVARLNHPNIVQVYDFNHDGDTYYMVLEYLGGHTLQDELHALKDRGERLPVGRIQTILTDVASAVGFAHERGMIHRDIKPGNVMLRDDGRVMLMDFGIAKMLGQKGLTGTGNVIGTAQYMAPEVVQGGGASPASDIYAMGIMMYEMMSGEPPFDGDSAISTMMKHINEPVPDLRQYAPDAPEGYVHVVEKALAKDPADRYQNAEAFGAAVSAINPAATSLRRTQEPHTEPMAPVQPPAPASTAPIAQPRSAPAAGSAGAPAAAPPAPPQAAPARSKINPVLPVALVGGFIAIVAVLGLGAFIFFGPGFGGASAGDDGGRDAAGAIGGTDSGNGEIEIGGGAAQNPTPTPTEVLGTGPQATPTPEPTATVTSTPTATPFPEPFVNITSVVFDGAHYEVYYEVYGVEPHDGTTGVPHVHFYWNNIDQTQAGSPGSGPWQLYYGPSPVYLNQLPAKPAGATAICALVANADHSYIADTGMCYVVEE